MVYAFGALKDYRLSLVGSDDGVKQSADSGNRKPRQRASVAVEGDELDVHARIQNLREKNPDLKIILAIGGWAVGSGPFKELTSNIFRMNQFVYDSTEFLRANNFDGLDIDWEYPRYVRLRLCCTFVCCIHLKFLNAAILAEVRTTGRPSSISSRSSAWPSRASPLPTRCHVCC